MIKFLLKRLAVSVFLLLGVTVIIFCIIRMLPGNPFLNMIQYDTDPAFLETKLEEIGYYDPTKDPAVVKIDGDKAKAWIANGAQPTDTVRVLLKKNNIL